MPWYSHAKLNARTKSPVQHITVAREEQYFMITDTQKHTDTHRHTDTDINADEQTAGVKGKA